MAGQQPMLSFAKVVSGLDLPNINNCNDSSAINAQQQIHLTSSTINAQNGNVNDIDKGVRSKLTNFKNKSEQGRRQNQRSNRNKRSGGGPKERRSVVSTETEFNELTESAASVIPPVVVFAPAPLPTVNAWFKQPQKGFFYLHLKEYLLKNIINNL